MTVSLTETSKQYLVSSEIMLGIVILSVVRLSVIASSALKKKYCSKFISTFKQIFKQHYNKILCPFCWIKRFFGCS